MVDYVVSSERRDQLLNLIREFEGQGETLFHLCASCALEKDELFEFAKMVKDQWTGIEHGKQFNSVELQSLERIKKMYLEKHLLKPKTL